MGVNTPIIETQPSLCEAVSLKRKNKYKGNRQGSKRYFRLIDLCPSLVVINEFGIPGKVYSKEP
jgi:hypothetical protein